MYGDTEPPGRIRDLSQGFIVSKET
jgi:hypothetical protein